MREGAEQHEAIGDLYFAADNFAGAAEEYSAALRFTEGEASSGRLRLMVRLAESHHHRGDFDASMRVLDAARRLARQLRPRDRAAVAAQQARTLIELGEYRRSRRYGLYAYQILRNTDDHHTVGQVGVTMGLCCARLGRSAEAIQWLQDAAATFRRSDDDDGLVTALNNLGLVYKNLREWREATRFLEQALKIDERAGLFARMRGHHQNLGLIRYSLGQWDLAEESFRRSLRISQEMGHQQGEANALMAVGRLARRRRQFDRAEEHFRLALALADRVGAQRESLLAREFLGEVEIDRGQATAALALLEPALEEARRLAPAGDLTSELEIRLGIALGLAGRIDEAQSHILKGAVLAERLGDGLEQAVAERALARLEALSGSATKLQVRIESAARSFERLSETYELAVTLAAWGELAVMLPAGQRAQVSLEGVADAARRAAALFRELGILPPAAGSILNLARLEAEREHYDQALSLLEQAESWLSESRDPQTQDRADALRRELEQQYVAVSLSTCNEFRALEEANRLFRDASDMDGLLAQAVKLSVENAGGDRGFVAFSSAGGRLDVVAQHGLGRDRARRILQVIESVAGPRIAENGPLFSSRVAADPRFGHALRDSLEGVGSLVCVPLNFPSQSVGIVYVDRLTDNLLGPFRQRELNLLAVFANTAAVAIVEAQRSMLLKENKALRERLKPTPGMERVVFQSRPMTDILQLLGKIGDSPATVLFMGETGTGKGLLAQVVHEISSRRERPFVQVNCAAIPEQLLESELFGYLHGAFTGALRDKVGLFEEAEGGTIFLDEIEKVPESVQAKLLHVLDRGEIRPVGATRSKRVDARVICATGCDLRQRIKEGRFLEDLYYRLNDITVRVPALRERREDIPILCKHFLTIASRQMEKNLKGFLPEVMRLFLNQEWRGNVRELEKTVKRMVVLADDGDALGLDLLPPEMSDTGPADEDRATSRSLRSNVAVLERRLIAEALERHHWNKSRAARELGLSYPTLLTKIRIMGIERTRPTSSLS